ncbi:YceD family protein [Sphingomonas colocasiae]|uniref:DUF177 domain-containing protein n=1 Tax=Sphingomonas colocasiae TaxID=1848973 RepID=A0ABS7PTF2_9SPHN|nr:YceD family protein [Sphingomonas colocasiae]MBY8824563.1 DUF177 domain-containing protein [Sphingomonas colocasiae]
MSAPEFSRIYRRDEVGERPREVRIEADAAERAALARRFDLQALDALAGTATITQTAAGIRASGRIAARATQSCVVTGEAVPAIIDEPFELLFVEESALASDAEEIELSAADCDVIGYDGQAIDLGEALAQTLALALDPFPRAPGADAALREAGVLKEEEAGAFGVLADLKKALEKGQD